MVFAISERMFFVIGGGGSHPRGWLYLILGALGWVAIRGVMVFRGGIFVRIRGQLSTTDFEEKCVSDLV